MNNIIGVVISILILLIGYLGQNFNMMLISVFILFAVLMSLSIKGKGKTLILLIFLISFFTLLLGNYFFSMIIGNDWTIDFSESINQHIIFCLYLSLLGILIGFCIANRLKETKKNDYDIEDDEKMKKIRVSARILFFLTIFFKIITVMEKIIFVQNNSYIALYTGYNSGLPEIVHKLSQINEFFFYVFLATIPSKDEIKKTMICFLSIEVISILSGGRTMAVTAVLFLLAYFMFREYRAREKQGQKYIWVKKRYITYSIILIPVIIAFLGAYNIIRNDIKIENFNIIKEFVNFFKDQGGSVKLIGYVKEYKEILPDTNTTYVFNPIIAFFREGIIGRYIFGIIPYKPQTIELALYGNNLGATLSYIIMPNEYLKGHGLGTQYIAEVYTDLGYIGVFIFNLLLGILLRKISFRTDLKWFFSAIYMSIIRLIIFMPRDFALSWTSEIYSISNWGSILLVLIVSKFINVKEKNHEDTLDS